MASIVENVIEKFLTQMETTPDIDRPIVEVVKVALSDNRLPTKETLLKDLGEAIEAGQHAED